MNFSLVVLPLKISKYFSPKKMVKEQPKESSINAFKNPPQTKMRSREGQTVKRTQAELRKKE